MTRFVHDQFAKQYLQELLSPIGEVETSRHLSAEVRQLDVLFSPSPTANPDLASLGLLGRFASTAAVFEPFRNAVGSSEVRSCVAKLFDLHAEWERQANRDNIPRGDRDLARLWILSPTASDSLLQGFGAQLDEDHFGRGVYFLPPQLKTAIVAIHQLPRTPETLWLRILGKGRVQRQAIAELQQLPETDPRRANALELLYNLRTILEFRQDVDSDDRELIMELSPLYRQRLEDATQTGIQQERRIMTESMLQTKFGEIDRELAQIIEPLVRLSPQEIAQSILQLNRDEILKRFRDSNSEE
jgi:hypothetical protein